MKRETQPANIIRQEIDAELSFLDDRPSLYYDIMRKMKGEKVVKKKISLGLVLVLILVLVTGTIAFAAAYRGVSYFLSEKTCEPASLDSDYLLSGLRQNHNSKYLNAAVVDAYWDGLKFSVAYHVSPTDPGQSIQMKCLYPEHAHDQPAEDADILLYEPEFINITDDETGEITRPLQWASDWVYEEDGSLTALISFPLYSMSQPASISIPIFNTLTSSEDLYRSMLHCYPPTLTDPIAEHEHKWAPAICVRPKTCTICNRTEGDLGYHNFQPSEDEEMLICVVCGSDMKRPFHIPQTVTLRTGDYNNFVMVLLLRLHDLGYYNGIFSGMYDDATCEAVKAYQKSQALNPDGVCRPETLKKLFPKTEKEN